MNRTLRCLSLFIFLPFALPAQPLPAASTRPDQVGDLALWLHAGDLSARHTDGHAIVLWPDRSGKGYDAVYEPRIPQASGMGYHNPPTLKAAAVGGRPAVSFNADNREGLVLNWAGHALNQGGSGFSAVFLVRPTLKYGPPPAPGVAWTKNRYLFLTHVSNYNSRMSVQIVEDSGEVKLFSRPVPAQQKVTQNSSFANGERQALSGDTWHRLMVTLDYKAKVARIFINGTVLERALPADSADTFEGIPSPVTGIGSTTLGDWLTCQIAEMSCYQRALTVDELRSLDRYLCESYGLTR